MDKPKYGQDPQCIVLHLIYQKQDDYIINIVSVVNLLPCQQVLFEAPPPIQYFTSWHITGEAQTKQFKLGPL